MGYYHCKNCNTQKYSKKYKHRIDVNKYCSNRCQKDYEYKLKIQNWLAGGSAGSFVKRYLLETRGNACEICHITEWQGQPIVFDMDHIDGNSQNNHIDNLRIICPNCHSQTPTFKNRNAGNGRHTRRERFAAGKSY